MKEHPEYILYQVARFGALDAQQILRICEGKCGRSSMYQSISGLMEDGLLDWTHQRGSHRKVYCATRTGREYVLHTRDCTNAGIRAIDLGHTLMCADVLMELSQYENVTGIATPFEIRPEEFRKFCHERIPDGIFRLTQSGNHFELALEIEYSKKNLFRMKKILDQYWQTFKLRMGCAGVLFVAGDKMIQDNYLAEIKTMPEEFQSRVRVVLGVGLEGLNSEAYGPKTSGIHRCLDKSRTAFNGDLDYSPVKTNVYLSRTTPKDPQRPVGSHEQIIGGV